MTICDAYDVAIVPFPFTDAARSKSRPALALSVSVSNVTHGQTIFAMITTGARSRWPSDVLLHDLFSAGLGHASVVRFKLFTLDNRLVSRQIGKLSATDRREVQQGLRAVIAI